MGIECGNSMCMHEELNFYPVSGSTTPNSLIEITVGYSLSLFSFFAAAFDPQSTVTWLL